MIPHLVATEVVRNLRTPEQVHRFFQLFQDCDFAFIIDQPVPRELVDKYARLGLPDKADAFIGAFAEWMEARYLISDNRHFLHQLQMDAFVVLDAESFITSWESAAQ